MCIFGLNLHSMNSLRAFLEQKTDLSESDWLFFENHLQEKKVPKKTMLTQSNSIEQYVYFVTKGVFRFFIELPEKDITFDFAFPNDIMSSYTSFLTQNPSSAAIESLTEAEVLYINRSDLQRFYTETKNGQAIGRLFAEEFFMRKSKREISFLTLSPTERYVNLFKEQANLLQEIPLKYLASYIGVTPQALSRIRNRI